MGSGLRRVTRALAVALALSALSTLLVATEAGASSPSASQTASQGADLAVAKAGAFVVSDFPAGFAGSPSSAKSHADNIRLAKGVDGCAPFVALQKAVTPLPQVKSPRFEDASRSIGNEVDVFPNERAATAALVLYAKSSVVGCLENLFEKQIRQDPDQRDALDDVVVTLDRQDIAGLGDESVVYEGNVELTGTDGSKHQIGIGSAAVRVGRSVDVVTYTTTGDALTDLLTPAIDASVSRLRAALARTES
jgi:hypothetical protein